jgi:putative NIF3 family GTP cyclohydrolase 1 type 2
MKIKQIIDEIIEFHQPCVVGDKTRDKVLAGNVEEECTGIVITCCATLEVLHKCVEQGANFIITHEGITYNYEKVMDLQDCDNEAVKTKLKYIADHKLCVWRDHDRMHGRGGFGGEKRVRSDLIFEGIMEELGWRQYLIGDELKPLMYRLPVTKASELAKVIAEKWNLNGVRMIGNPDADVSTVFFCEHAFGGERDIPIIDKCRQADAIIPLEICDYTVATYVRDASYMGQNKVLIEMGHFNTEELGMKYFARKMATLFENRVSVKFIQSGNEFTYPSR